MTQYMNTNEASLKWGISTRRITKLCTDGSITGAIKDGKNWMIPTEAKKPEKGAKSSSDDVLPLPIGIEDFREISQGCYYVDKTLMIKDIVTSKTKSFLFTRPRRFGKSLNMSMLKLFFERTNEDTSPYFMDKKIWTCGSDIIREQGKYPVIYLSFKDIRYKNWNDAYEAIKNCIRQEVRRHMSIIPIDKLNSFDERYIHSMLDMSGSLVDYTLFLNRITEIFDALYQEKTVIIIDEYDTPIQTGFMNSYYDDVINFMRQFLASGLKGNQYLKYGFLTGILRVANESLFSGLNNLAVFTILDKEYSEYFGFTTKEVETMAHYYHAASKIDELKEWYDGYLFWELEIYNPWSITNYFNRKCIPGAYWTDTSDNSEINHLLQSISNETSTYLSSLLTNEYISVPLDMNIIYPKMSVEESSIFSFLLVSGYLKYIPDEDAFTENNLHKVAIPNKEIRKIYTSEIINITRHICKPTLANTLQQNLVDKNIKELQKNLQSFILETVSYNDATDEKFYHGMMLGLSAIMSSNYRITSNRESGLGRYDLQFFPLKADLPGIIMEFKWTKKDASSSLDELASKALSQSKNNHYTTEMISQNITNIITYGIAFSGKHVVIKVM